MEIFLTSGIDATDKYFDNLSNIIRVNVKDLVLNKRNKTLNAKYNKFEIITDFILELKEEDVIIGNAISSIEDYINLKEKLSSFDIKIKQVFIKYADTYLKYKEQYSNFANWMDYSPEFIKSKDIEHNQKIKKLINILVLDNVEIKYINF